MRILILGGDGMLGHQLLKSWQGKHDVKVTLRGDVQHYATYGLFHAKNSFYRLDMLDFSSVESVVKGFQPEAVVNAVGIVKQRADASDAILSLEVNALLPHRLSVLCAAQGVRLIHLSTDCVFSGKQGMYREGDLEDATDLYGRTKLLGELHEDHTVTLRTSIIGLELSRKSSLIEWFLAQSGKVKGFTKAVYSGFTTQEMARLIENILLKQPHVSGLWHVASQPIDKYTLLSKLCRRLDRQDLHLIPEVDFYCERSLNATRFNQATHYMPASWDQMLTELAQQIKARAS